MPRRPATRQADLDRVLKALAARGLAPARIEVRPGGEVVIVPGPAAAPALTAVEPPAQPETLDTWRARKNARHPAKGS